MNNNTVNGCSSFAFLKEIFSHGRSFQNRGHKKIPILEKKNFLYIFVN